MTTPFNCTCDLDMKRCEAHSGKTTPQTTKETTAQKLQDLYFANGAMVSIETWNETLATLDTYAEAVRREFIQNEIKYWKGVFDAAPVRETEHPHDTVARNFARIEIERLEALTPTNQTNN
jgi:hypothetical protein